MNESSSLPLEIERKFLIAMPDRERLKQESDRFIPITQTYLLPGEDGANRRVRRTGLACGTRFFYTEKLKLSDVTRIEKEREILTPEYMELLTQADPARKPIEKTRWCVPYAGHTLEIDVFPFWTRQAFCEVELRSEDEELLLPDWIHVLREVTADWRYTNSALALEIPPED